MSHSHDHDHDGHDHDHDHDEEHEEEVTDLSSSDVVTRYKMAADIVNLALQGVIQQCTPGKKISDICAFGDAVIEQRCAAVFKSKKIEKGVAFPTCISVNEQVCHNSPLSGESGELKDGDWIKVDLGCHVDGYIAVAAHTFVIQDPEAEITGKAADVLLATYYATEVCKKLIKPGNTNTMVTKALDKIAESFGVNHVSGTLMHQMKRFVIDGNKVIVQKDEVEQRVEEITFEPNEVYAIDVCFSSGEGKPKEGASRTTVFKRAVDRNYRLKMKASRYVLTEVNNRFPTMPFSIRALGDEKQARMGVVECVNHELLYPYPILFEKPGDIVAHLKTTALLLPSGTSTVTGVPLPLDKIKSDKTVDEETAAILATSSKNKKKKKKTSKKKEGEEAEE